MSANRFWSLVRAAGAVNAVMTVIERIVDPRPPFLATVRNELAGAHVLEIGGPSQRFRPGGSLPLYDVLASIDNITFAHETIWEGRLGKTYEPTPSVKGRQFIREGTSVSGMEGYDAVISCHVLEHLANPLKALLEWRALINPGGLVLLVVPYGAKTFDRKRPITAFKHLLYDFEQDVQEDDMTHAQEVLAMHDFRRDPGLESRLELEHRVANNAALRSMHHHVFDNSLLRQALEFSGFEIPHLEYRRPFDLVAVARPKTTPPNPKF